VLNLVRHNNSSRKIIQDGCVLLLVAHESELQSEDLSLLDGFILDTDNPTSAYDIVKTIRTHADLKIALKPLFFGSIYQLPNHVLLHTEGAIELSMMSSYVQRIATINKRIRSVQEPKLVSHEVSIQHKTLAYLYTRNTQLKPIHSRESFIGYEFPFVSLFYKKTEAVHLLNTLQKATEKNLLSFKLQDYIHLCKSCSGNYLNFRECCPKCDSIDIAAHDMIHHFVCAHVAPEKDFKKEDGLECPKCDKNLRHIGIDYDKPSTIYSCNSCSHEFQNPGMLSLCLDCGTENQLEELMQKSIGTYALTQNGEQQLFRKVSESSSRGIEHKEHLGSMSVPLFKILLEQEIKRVKATNGSSYFAAIQFQNNQLQLLNSDAKKGLMKEISGIIKPYLKDTDILSAERFNSYYILMPETKEYELERLENIDYNLAKLLSDNVLENRQEIEISVHQINGGDSLQTYFS
jgi:hypothetical protein